MSVTQEIATVRPVNYGERDEEGCRSWIALLRCGHETKLRSDGHRPRRGFYAICPVCTLDGRETVQRKES